MNDYQARMEAAGIETRPITVDYVRGKRLYWVPARSWGIIAKVMSQRSGWTLRKLAEATGYSLTGLIHALDRLASWGVLSRRSTRGWAGRTSFILSDQVSAARANVPTTDTLSTREEGIPVSVGGTLPQSGPMKAALEQLLRAQGWAPKGA